MEKCIDPQKYDRCTYEPYLKCINSEKCIECLRIENNNAKKWIKYVKTHLPIIQPEIELIVEET
jgi:hypothetical protein